MVFFFFFFLRSERTFTDHREAFTLSASGIFPSPHTHTHTHKLSVLTFLELLRYLYRK